jgi:hypothetical protein
MKSLLLSSRRASGGGGGCGGQRSGGGAGHSSRRQQSRRWRWALGSRVRGGAGHRSGRHQSQRQRREAEFGGGGVMAMAEEGATMELWWWRCSGDGDGGAPENFGSLTTSLQIPPISMFSVRGTVPYIGRVFLMSVVLMWPTPKICIFGVGHPYMADTYDYWYRLY